MLWRSQETLGETSLGDVLTRNRPVINPYLIDYAMGRVFLYQPCTKQPISVSLERTVIEHADTLGLAGPGKNCRSGLAGSS